MAPRSSDENWVVERALDAVATGFALGVLATRSAIEAVRKLAHRPRGA